MNIPKLLKNISIGSIAVVIIYIFMIGRLRPTATAIEKGDSNRSAPVTDVQKVVPVPARPPAPQGAGAAAIPAEILEQVKSLTVEEVKAWEAESRLQAFNENDQEMTLTILAMPETRLKELKAKVEAKYPLPKNQYRNVWDLLKRQDVIGDLSVKRTLRLKLKGVKGQEYDSLVVEKRPMNQPDRTITLESGEMKVQPASMSITEYEIPDGRIPPRFSHLLQIQADP